MKNATLLILVAIGLVMSLAVPAQALIVENTAGQKVFLDDFENGTVGSAPTLTSPQIGSWTSTPSALVRDVSTAPGPFEGAQFLQVHTAADIGGINATSFDSAVTGTGTLHM